MRNKTSITVRFSKTQPKQLIIQENTMKPGRFNWLRALCRSLFVGAIFVGALIGMTQLTYAASEYAAAWGPDIGSTAPMLSALDQHGKQQNQQSLNGPNGLLFVFNRSVDW